MTSLRTAMILAGFMFAAKCAWACDNSEPPNLLPVLDPYIAGTPGALIMTATALAALTLFPAAFIKRSKKIGGLGIILLLCSIAVFVWRSHLSPSFC